MTTIENEAPPKLSDTSKVFFFGLFLASAGALGLWGISGALLVAGTMIFASALVGGAIHDLALIVVGLR